ncbi:UDP-4-amino-4,6-dideoxy-N-acetyl-beta-L-altrosamine N-acetyltransferase [Nitrincola tibetensis]|uniref:UDP-4-amino-4, 6-dideoxy-N-acetyl-beta-L-altrosamine N-acetyltransferase n=1 Tax=Nitrincola tibetensis TaxID=2219697 RepID=UPI0019606D23|nr:UDP-4-amino-4,6-dideoxy-N-acetyl-beta-L-altrosamine N-acetyltransferase [Nitrincola tibetensis]
MSTFTGSLKRVEHRDLPLLITWRNHPDVRAYMYSQHQISPAEHQQWFDRQSHDQNSHLFIYSEESQPCGFAQLRVAKERAEWGFYLAPEAKKGTGTRLGKTVLDWAFQNLNLHKVSGEALDFNHASIRFHHKLGFVDEGRLRDHIKINETFHDVLCFGLLESEWAIKREAL